MHHHREDHDGEVLQGNMRPLHRYHRRWTEVVTRVVRIVVRSLKSGVVERVEDC